jgi:uncharacterized protein
VRSALRTGPAWGVALALLVAGAALAAEVPPRPPDRPILDRAGVLSPEQVVRLDARLRRLYESTGVTTGVLTVESVAPDTVQAFAGRAFNEWRLWEGDRRDGVLIVLAVNDRQVWVEVGYDLEGVLPDGRTGALLDRHALPAFRRGAYGEGLLALADQMAAILEAEAPRGAPRPTPPAARRGLDPQLILLFFFLAVILSLMLRRGGRRGIGPGRRRYHGGPLIIPGGFGGFGGGSSGRGWGGFGGGSRGGWGDFGGSGYGSGGGGAGRSW